MPRLCLKKMNKDRLQKRLYSLEDAGAYLNRSKWSIRELYYKGVLPAVKVGRRIDFDLHDLNDFIDKHKIQIDY